MEIDFDQVELGLVVNLTILREVLRTLSTAGKKWWMASLRATAPSIGSRRNLRSVILKSSYTGAPDVRWTLEPLASKGP